jgi:hypothetical protein
VIAAAHRLINIDALGRELELSLNEKYNTNTPREVEYDLGREAYMK